MFTILEVAEELAVLNSSFELSLFDGNEEEYYLMLAYGGIDEPDFGVEDE
jgi:hypothetical protein